MVARRHSKEFLACPGVMGRVRCYAAAYGRMGLYTPTPMLSRPQRP